MGQRTERETSEHDRQQYGLDFSEHRHEPSTSPAAVRWYVAALLLFPFLLLIGSLVWMATPEYQRHSQFPSFVGLGYGLRLHNADCEIVVDGDSTALTGVMPSVIQQATGLKTCNIAEVAGVKYINGMVGLDEYLAHNRPPRYLVLQFAPENLNDPRNWIEVAHFEGWFYALRFLRGRALLERAWQEPEDLMISAELGLRTGLQWLPARTLPPELSEIRERTGGRMPEPGATPRVCASPLIQRDPDPRWLQLLRDRYDSRETQVFIDVTPEAACDPSFAYYAARTGGSVTDNTLGALPLIDYTDSGRLHTTDLGAETISERIAKQIEARQIEARQIEVRQNDRRPAPVEER